MSEIEKMQRYIERTPKVSTRYSVTTKELNAIKREISGIEAVVLAFEYGQAKGYRAAKAEVRHEHER